jgi:hypothetical protein
MAGTGYVNIPVPARLMKCGLPGALSLTVTEPFRGPAAVGVKVTSMVQVAPGFTVPPEYGQEVSVVAGAKSPLVAMLAMLSEPVPVLVSVTD